MADSGHSTTVRLTSRDWDASLGGWRCDLLTVGGTEVVALFDSGSRLDTKLFSVEPEIGVIRWAGAKRPSSVSVQLNLASGIASQQEVDKWKKLSILLPFVAALLATATTLFVAYLEADGPPLDSKTQPDERLIFESAFQLQFVDRNVLNQVVPSIQEERPDGLGTMEEVMASTLWQVKAQDGFAEFLCGDRFVSVTASFEEDSTSFEWDHGTNPLPRIAASLGIPGQLLDLPQLNSELNVLGICWLPNGDTIVRGIDGGLAVVSEDG